MSDAIELDWNGIWVALQELGAALKPVLHSGNIPPRWADTLSTMLDEAIPDVEERCSDDKQEMLRQWQKLVPSTKESQIPGERNV
jgi:hypothetical protein